MRITLCKHISTICLSVYQLASLLHICLPVSKITITYSFSVHGEPLACLNMQMTRARTISVIMKEERRVDQMRLEFYIKGQNKEV